jgi:hypothetical protein
MLIGNHECFRVTFNATFEAEDAFSHAVDKNLVEKDGKVIEMRVMNIKNMNLTYPCSTHYIFGACDRSCCLCLNALHRAL